HVIERFESGRMILSVARFTPDHSALDSVDGRTNVEVSGKQGDFVGSVSYDYWQLRSGFKLNRHLTFAPFVFWNPVVPNHFGSVRSHWSASFGWEGIFAGAKSGKLGSYQPDNSIYSP